jgi:hypothetical protein
VERMESAGPRAMKVGPMTVVTGGARGSPRGAKKSLFWLRHSHFWIAKDLELIPVIENSPHWTTKTGLFFAPGGLHADAQSRHRIDFDVCRDCLLNTPKPGSVEPKKHPF